MKYNSALLTVFATPTMSKKGIFFPEELQTLGLYHGDTVHVQVKGIKYWY